MLKQLIGHTSPETAYVVNDYPYGFRLRCKIRYWIETKPGHGQRFVSQTTNPKKPTEVWNKPKASTYKEVMILCVDDQGHVHGYGLSLYERPDVIEAFARSWQLDASQQAYLAAWVRGSRLMSATYERQRASS